MYINNSARNPLPSHHLKNKSCLEEAVSLFALALATGYDNGMKSSSFFFAELAYMLFFLPFCFAVYHQYPDIIVLFSAEIQLSDCESGISPETRVCS